MLAVGHLEGLYCESWFILAVASRRMRFGVRVKVLVHLGQSGEETGKEFLNIKLIRLHSQNGLSEMDGVEPCLWSQERGSWVFFIFKELNFDPLYSFSPLSLQKIRTMHI